MAHLLGAEAVSVAFGGESVLAGVSLGMADGDRIGVVGANGAGKSTLLAVLAGRRQPDSGRVTHRSGVAVGWLDQTDSLTGGATVRDVALGGRPDHAWAAEPRSRDAVGALLGGVPLDAPVGALSGGQRRRVALAQVLLGHWDVLFLDEPNETLAENRRWHEPTPELPRNLADVGGARPGRCKAAGRTGTCSMPPRSRRRHARRGSVSKLGR
ncbi:MAG: ATP-binding cassette domain-containing protein [Bifidobacteriaceae bacterium]|jgi:ATPase subunit of ABC transporter with duplicated ATPase domains|nr:ATP-binding cassette domain-containing protein [Bifidobacteriaceae bacterium]